MSAEGDGEDGARAMSDDRGGEAGKEDKVEVGEGRGEGEEGRGSCVTDILEEKASVVVRGKSIVDSMEVDVSITSRSDDVPSGCSREGNEVTAEMAEV